MPETQAHGLFAAYPLFAEVTTHAISAQRHLSQPVATGCDETRLPSHPSSAVRVVAAARKQAGVSVQSACTHLDYSEASSREILHRPTESAVINAKRRATREPTSPSASYARSQ